MSSLNVHEMGQTGPDALEDQLARSQIAMSISGEPAAQKKKKKGYTHKTLTE